jgi:hypothetical protein
VLRRFQFQTTKIVIASEAKQSISPREEKNGLLRRFAPLRKRFAFVAGNDEKTQLRDLAAQFARVLAGMCRPLTSEGAGNAGRWVRPQMG